MIDVTHKRTTLRTAVAQAQVFCARATLDAVRERRVPKGDVLSVSRAAGLLAAKRVPDLLPFCHPIPLEHAEILFAVEADCIRIEIEVKAIARTGVEVEAMTAAAVAALNIYDMLKPIDDAVRIGDIHLIRKQGGKSDFTERLGRPVAAAVLVASDAVSAGKKQDKAGAAVRARLEREGIQVAHYATVADEAAAVAGRVRAWTDAGGVDLVFTCGGTGLGPRDTTVEAVRPLIERDVPGIAEAMRAYGMERTPHAALSRGIAGQRGRTLIVTLPGSTAGAGESLDALLPWVLHVIRVFDKAYRHDEPA